ncbi:hypothetical protein ACFVFD_36070 [Streptomyces fimicarius]|uniref:hypothetical protein n=1 Tax=Streptomyces griseus TaxID=1911 RepID=UPI0036A2ED60
MRSPTGAGTRTATTTVTRCVGAICAGRRAAGEAGRTANSGLRLCQACLDRLSTELRRLPELYEACGRRLDGGTQDTLRPRTSGGPLRGMPFNVQAAEVRTEILTVLGSWAGAVAEKRGVAAPRREVLPLRVFLGRHLAWLAAHDAAGDFCGEVARLARRARRVADPEVRRRLPIGGCAEPDCSGSLTAVVGPGQPRTPAVISCDQDPDHRWLGHEWLQLSDRLRGTASAGNRASRQADADTDTDAKATGGEAEESGSAAAAAAVRWVTAADVARLWQMPTGTVYRHASEAGWRRRSARGRTYYRGEDVVATLAGRGAARSAG